MKTPQNRGEKEMELNISNNGPLHKGTTTRIPNIDSDLKQFRWHCANTAKRFLQPRYYAVHKANKASAAFFGVPVGTDVYLHRVLLARKLKISYAELQETKRRCAHKNGYGLDNRRTNLRLKRSGE
jgi:hypothetical protein